MTTTLTKSQIEEKISSLREKYMATVDPVDKRIIAGQGKMLRWVLEKMEKNVQGELKFEKR